MILLFRYWLGLCLLRAAPQDGPVSRVVLGYAMICYFLVSMLATSIAYDPQTGVRLALLDLLLLAVFILLILFLPGKSARIHQTLSAMTGAGTVLGLAALPLVFLQGTVPESGYLPVVLSSMWLLLLFWNLVVSAHIMRHALSTTFAMGLVVSVLYMLITTQIVASLIPLQGPVMQTDAGR